ncbi:MAG: tetratricopeptide repeat protein [Candidatus Melainabacteria bacterium]
MKDLLTRFESFFNEDFLGFSKGLLALAGLAFVGFISVCLSIIHFVYIVPEDALAELSAPPWRSLNVSSHLVETQTDFKRIQQTLFNMSLNAEHKADPIPFYLLAKLSELKDDDKEALYYYEQSRMKLEASPLDMHRLKFVRDDILLHLASFYYFNNKMKEARVALVHIQDVDRLTDPRLYVSLDNVLYESRRADYHYEMAQVLKDDLAFRKAREELHKALSLCSDERLKETIQNYEKTNLPLIVNDIAPEHRYYLRMGMRLEDTGNVEVAIRLYKKVLKQYPKLELASHLLASAYLKNNKVTEAIHHSQSSLQVNPDFYLAYLTLGDIELEAGQMDRTLNHYQQALNIVRRFSDEANLGLAANIENHIAYVYETLHVPGLARQHYAASAALSRQVLAMEESSDIAPNSANSAEDLEYSEEALRRLGPEGQSREEVATGQNHVIKSKNTSR